MKRYARISVPTSALQEKRILVATYTPEDAKSDTLGIATSMTKPLELAPLLLRTKNSSTVRQIVSGYVCEIL